MKKYWLFCLTLIILVFAVEYDVARRFRHKSLRVENVISMPTPIINEETSGVEAVVVPAPTDESEIFAKNNFLGEAQKISQLQINPGIAEQKIESLANSMNSADIYFLSQVIESRYKNRDERAMAIELLSRKKTEEALNILNQFVESKQAPIKNTNQNEEFESVLRAQAIEGIASYPRKDLALSYLNSLADKVDESFLKDRILRSSENLIERPAVTGKQEEANLKQLIE